MKKTKMLFTTKVNDFNNVELGVYGIFDTEKVEWKYFVVSYTQGSYGSLKMSNEICNTYGELDATNVQRCGKEFKTKEEGIQYINEFKIKWETGSNTTIEEKRDQKLKDILDK
jgi:hypothetical protein